VEVKSTTAEKIVFFYVCTIRVIDTLSISVMTTDLIHMSFTEFLMMPLLHEIIVARKISGPIFSRHDTLAPAQRPVHFIPECDELK